MLLDVNLSYSLNSPTILLFSFILFYSSLSIKTIPTLPNIIYMTTDKDILIIPDVHGRTFWKAPLAKYESDLASSKMHCVFLGDYLDPYPFEIELGEVGGYKQTVANLVEICDKKKQLGDSVTMLFGNHDLHYIDEYTKGEAYKCRYMHHYAKQIKKIFSENWDNFSLAYETTLSDGRRCLFTHAGVTRSWVSMRFDNMTDDSDITAAWLNSFLVDKSKLYVFGDVGEERGGRGCGSPVWADVDEFIWGWKNEEARKHAPGIRKTMFTSIFQVFGHTLRNIPYYKNGADNYIINEHFAMLDVKRAFIMHPDGTIEPVS